MSNNYQALGEYTAYKMQARDAFRRRHVIANNLGVELQRLAERADKQIDADEASAQIREIAAAEKEAHAALARANQAAPLCGQQELTAAMLLNERI